jgi:hypothetical protein
MGSIASAAHREPWNKGKSQIDESDHISCSTAHRATRDA